MRILSWTLSDIATFTSVSWNVQYLFNILHLLYPLHLHNVVEHHCCCTCTESKRLSVISQPKLFIVFFLQQQSKLITINTGVMCDNKGQSQIHSVPMFWGLCPSSAVFSSSHLSRGFRRSRGVCLFVCVRYVSFTWLDCDSGCCCCLTELGWFGCSSVLTVFDKQRWQRHFLLKGCISQDPPHARPSLLCLSAALRHKHRLVFTLVRYSSAAGQ